MNFEHSSMTANAICFEASRVGNCATEQILAFSGPEFTLRPRLFIDENQWCALYGEDIQSGLAGFGDSPHLAMMDFNKNYYKKLETKKP